MPGAKQTLELRPDYQLGDQSFWLLRPDESRRHEAVIASLSKFRSEHDKFRNDPVNDDNFRLHVNEFPLRPHELVIVFGKRFSEIQGHMSLQISEASSNVGSISRLDGLGETPTGLLLDMNGKPVTRSSLASYAGYAQYSGQGNLCHLDLIYTQDQGQGIGTCALQLLKTLGYELIELEALGEMQVDFFEKAGFVDIGIDSDKHLVMVWNNPLFAEKKR